MTREEFVSLPAAVALGILWDTGKLADRLANIEAQKRPRPQKYDSAIYRKDGIQWASETDSEGLRFWRNRYAESAEKGGEYAEKDRKRATTLDFWIAWRLAEPTTQWVGERNNETVTAKPPSGKPTVYPKDSRGQSSQREPEPEAAAPSFDDDDSDIPF